MKELLREYLDYVIALLGVVFIAISVIINLVPMMVVRDTQNPWWLLIWVVTIPVSIMAVKRVYEITNSNMSGYIGCFVDQEKKAYAKPFIDALEDAVTGLEWRKENQIDTFDKADDEKLQEWKQLLKTID